MKGTMVRIGVLALQGSVKEHIYCIEKSCALPVEVRKEKDLDNIDGLIIPGGESTTLGILLCQFNLLQPLREKINGGIPVWGTCAGMILLAKKITAQKTVHLAVMDIEVMRNAYGSQLLSHKASAILPEISPLPIQLVFIRAPIIKAVLGDVKVLASLNGRITAARQKNMLATSFHPELTEDLSFYRYFIDKMIRCK